MRLSYRKKLFISFVFIFSLFTAGVVIFEQSREGKYKTDALTERLDAFAQVANAVLIQQGSLDSTNYLFPSNLRLTLVDLKGNVLYDNVITEISGMENHFQRPEIVKARENKTGSDIRTSSSNSQKYIYFAKRFNTYYIRVALPYNVQVQNFLKSDNLFVYFIIGLFVIILIIIHYASGRFGDSIRKLNDFSNAGEQAFLDGLKTDFPDDELGKIGNKIAENYLKLNESKKTIIFEHEKLLQHVHSSEEGICFFATNKSVEFYNGLFIHYLNTIIDEADSTPSAIFSSPDFENVNAFLASHHLEHNYFETKIEKQAKIFAVRINRFENSSFEMIINDITNTEKTRVLKQEMTGNITHELRTPVAGIRGCLETVLAKNLDVEKQQYFIEKAYRQSLVLSELIQDMSLLTKIEDAPQSFCFEPVNVPKMLEELKKEYEIILHEKSMNMEWQIPENLHIFGNHNLLYAIFRNLTDNAVRYAGNNTSIHIHLYNEDKDYYYFSYFDTGIGISEEQHLNRLFERFYRIGEGRTRETGGSGLGLSIVKNAVLFHKGVIVAKNRVGGGLEFLFTFKK
ncbi:MAG: HAMP domain-containing histidine kinase [Bacteroidetes bacterium]|nr:HAMP domain-containing histidine kinase [Bacteroidota bacterium]MCL1969673.1 HAMP domain-containing histidine kinase [Bacteroidota bacterium]